MPDVKLWLAYSHALTHAHLHAYVYVHTTHESPAQPEARSPWILEDWDVLPSLPSSKSGLKQKVGYLGGRWQALHSFLGHVHSALVSAASIQLGRQWSSATPSPRERAVEGSPFSLLSCRTG